MTAPNWSPKQFRLISMRETIPETRVIVPGPVRSGKTYPAMWGWLRYNSMTFAGHTFALLARTQRQFDNVVMANARLFCRDTTTALRKAGNDWAIDSWAGGPPNTYVQLLGSHRDDAQKALGMTFSGGFIDECVVIPIEFIRAVEERTSVYGAKVVMTCNPGGPKHPIKRDYVDRADDPDDDFDGVHIPFELADNPSLTERFIQNLHDTYANQPIERERKIYGRWVAEEGSIYPFFDSAVSFAPREGRWRLEAAIDHADSSVTHAGLWGRYPEGTWCIAEWRHDARTEGEQQPREQARLIVDAFLEYGHVAAWVVDPTAQEFRVELQRELNARRLGTIAEAGYNQVKDGIGVTRDWIKDRLHFDPSVEHVIDDMANIAWDPRAAERGEDKPIPTRFHGADLTRYYAMQRHVAEGGIINIEMISEGVHA